jgi:hypothetical protein
MAVGRSGPTRPRVAPRAGAGRAQARGVEARGAEGDAGISFGVPPERHWPYDVTRYDEEPEAFLYAYASCFKALDYTRVDAMDLTGAETVGYAKRVLAAGYVIAFGFPVYSSISNQPDIPFPTSTTASTAAMPCSRSARTTSTE